jgi:hypothetical protein
MHNGNVSEYRNLIHYDQDHYPFSDHFSQFSVSFPAGGPLGIGAVNPKSVLATYHISKEALQLWMVENGQMIAVQRRSIISDPWQVLEEASVLVPEGSIQITARHLFINERRFVSEFVFCNASDLSVEICPAWLGSIAADDRLYMLHYFKGANTTPRQTFLQPVKGGVRGGLCNPQPADLPEVGMTIRMVSSETQVWLGESPHWAASETPSLKSVTASGHPAYYGFLAAPIRLAANAEIRFQFVVDVCFTSYLHPGLKWTDDKLAPVDMEILESRNHERFLDDLNPETLANNLGPHLRTRLLRSRFALLRDGLRGLDGEFGDEIACLCTADASDFSCSFFWDTLFSSVAIGDFNQKYARGAIRTVFTRHLARDGSTPERKFNYSVPQRMAQQAPQAPVASWAVVQYLARHTDPGFLSEIYPFLKANHTFWEKFSDMDQDGLSEWRWSGQICDNSPLWDDYSAFTDLSGCGWVPPVASVSLNSFLYMDARHMKDLSQRLGKLADVEYFDRRMSMLQDKLFEICYLPEERRFWDYNHHTGRHARVKTFYMFWPLVCGMPVPEDTARDLIENVLLDPGQFFGAIPFPSVAYDEPTFNPAGYWRGKAWPHISYWLLQMLCRYGYEKQADEAAHRILAWYSARDGFMENLTTDPADVTPNGYPDYNWGCAAFSLLANRSYALP